MSNGPRDWWAADPEPDEPAQPVAESSPAAPPPPVDEPVAAAEEPAAVEPPAVAEEPLPAAEPAAAEQPAVEPAEPAAADLPVADEPVAESAPATEEPTVEPPTEAQPVTPEPVAAEPVPEPVAAEPEPDPTPEPAEPVVLEPVVPVTAEEPAVAAGARGAGPLARSAAVSLVLFALLAAALATVTTVKLAGNRPPCGPVGSGQQLAEVATAASSVKTVLSYDYRHLDTDFAAAERLLTPTFRKKYVDTTNKGVKPLAVKYKAITSADVTGAGLVSTTRGSCDHVLVLVQQTVTNSQLAQPRLDRSRIDVLMVHRNGQWLIGDLNPL